MAMTDLIGGFLYPAQPMGGLTTTLLGATRIFSANHAYAAIFQVPKTGNIRKIHWGTQTITTGATIDVRLETVSTTDGFPTGSLVAANTNAGQVVANADDNVFFTSTLTADASVTAGQQIAFVLKNPAVSSGDLTFSGSIHGTDAKLPYGSHLQASYANTSLLLMFSLEYDDGSMVPIPGILPPCTAITATNVSTSTTPDVMGWLFTAPMAMRVLGAWIWVDRDADLAVKLVSTAYNQGAGTGILATSGTLDANIRKDGAGGVSLVYFTASVDLVAGTDYRVVVEPTTTTNVVFYDFNTDSLLSLGAWPMGGCLTTAKDPTANGDWTNFNSGTFRRPPMGLIVGGLDVASGSGGGVSRSRVQRRM
jgi:hypothetical protein